MPNRLTQHVSPFLGIEGGGNCLVGPYRPLGLVRPGPQAYSPEATGIKNNGWLPVQPIRRFAQIHVSGTGGTGRYGNIALSPYAGKASFDFPSHGYVDEEAAPGYYSVQLLPDAIRTEITATRRCALYRFHFENACTKRPSRILFDGAAALGGESTRATDGYLHAADRQHLYGWTHLVGGWGHRAPFQIFYFVEFDRPCLDRRVAEANCEPRIPATRSTDLRIDLDFGDSRKLECRIGVSFISVAQARANLERETGGRDFDDLRAESEADWETQLQRVRVEGGSHEDTVLHYSMLHRLLAMPGDLGLNEEFPLWHSGVRQFNDFFCLWDSCRNANGFLGLAYAPLQRDIVNCLLDVGRHTGWLFDAWISFHHGFQQGGCSADILLSEAALRKLPGIDYREALRLARKHFEEEPEDPSTRGRYLREWREAGYVSTALNERQVGCVSRQIEYSYHDHCLGRLAETLGDQETAATCFANARKVWRLWHPEKKCFFPKDAAGRWAPDYDITKIHPEARSHAMDPYFFEGTAVEWALCPLHVMDDIIRAHGGPTEFTAHLDDFFTNKLRKWKEIILHTPYLYHLARRPDKTADEVRRQRRRYHTGRDGIPDNEDMGSNATFALATGIGLYPFMGEARYWLSPPRFREIDLRVGMGDTRLHIRTTGADPAGDAPTYIASASLDGAKLPQPWVEHHAIAPDNGRDHVLEIHLSNEPAPD